MQKIEKHLICRDRKSYADTLCDLCNKMLDEMENLEPEQVFECAKFIRETIVNLIHLGF